MTLIEVLITLAIVSVIAGLALISVGGATSGARLRQSATQVSGAIRVAYAHATATSKVVRLTFDFQESKILLEEAQGRHLIRDDDSGGAEAATEMEQAAQAEAEKVAKGPRAPRASFAAVTALGFPEEGKTLPGNIQFWQIDTQHQAAPIREGRAYLYFFPGGQTETAAIQLRISNADEEDKSSFLTVQVASLTGRTKIEKGRTDMPKPRDEQDASDLEDPGP
ncbi:MAG TPA: prepilin-type N-terminal cleavage/methylation domain-containing protein [Polyangiaceae bacterium]|nr:prepilin-type N-terminal cleavage/methylation domain-containing protein [Polyangiaceae bacterium]